MEAVLSSYGFLSVYVLVLPWYISFKHLLTIDTFINITAFLYQIFTSMERC